MNCNASCAVVVSRGTTSTLDLGTLAGQDRRRAPAFRKSYLMRIRRRDKDPAETAGPGGPGIAPYDYDEDGSPAADPVVSLIAEPAEPAEPVEPVEAEEAPTTPHVGAATDPPPPVPPFEP